MRTHAGSLPAVPAIPEGKAPSVPVRPALTEPVDRADLAASIGARLIPGAGTPTTGVVGVTLRAQHVRPGDLFAALPGARVHGADFVGDAIAAGAIAVLTDEAGLARPAMADIELPVVVHPDPRRVLGDVAARIYGYPSRKLAVLGTTGTSGKTTTSYLVEAGLRAAGRTTGLVGTVETRIAGQRLASAFTTPEAPELQALLALMVEQGVTHVAMEVSSHALDMGRVTGTEFAVGAFTNLSQDHLDYHPTMADYFAAKAKLFDGRSRIEVVFVDGEWGRKLVKPNTITVSTERAPGEATWTAVDARTNSDGGQSFTAIGPDGLRLALRVRLPGTFNVANALLAAAMLHATGIPSDAIVAGLSEVDVPGRMERVDLGQEFTAVVDYSHKPAAVALALDAVRAQLDRAGGHGRVITVLGCGGDRDTGKRPLMGQAAARRSALLIVTDDNPRSEDPAAIRAAMLAGALAVPPDERGEVVEVDGRRQAIHHAVAAAKPGDVVVVAGKGHETGQEINGVVYPFSDRDELAEAIHELSMGRGGGGRPRPAVGEDMVTR